MLLFILGLVRGNVCLHNYSADSTVKVTGAAPAMGQDSSLASVTQTENDVLEDAITGTCIRI